MEANNGLKVFVRKDEVLTLSDELSKIRLEEVVTNKKVRPVIMVSGIYCL